MMRLGDQFRSNERIRLEAERNRRHWFIKSRKDQERREDEAAKLQDDIASFAADTVMMLASEMQIQRFEAKLDTYDEATVVALMENSQALDAVKDRLAVLLARAYVMEGDHPREVRADVGVLLARAYVMEDGRRVFKTQDGTQVYDEFGKKVGREELDYDLISPDRPTWEAYKPDFERRQQLEAERHEIEDFQQKVDAAREQIAEGEISKEDLDQLDADLADAMPPSVAAHVPGYEGKPPAADLKSDFARETSPMSDLETATTPVHHPEPM